MVVAFILLMILGSVRPAAAVWNPLLERLVEDGFDRAVMEGLFNRAEVRFEPDAMAGKLHALIRSRSIDQDAAERLKSTVRRDYLGKKVIARASAFLTDNLAVLDEIEGFYGVPKEIIVSILLIETHLGRNTGSQCVFNRLASMALSCDLETVRSYLDADLLSGENEEYVRRRCREKSDWAYHEFKALLLLAQQNGSDPLGIRGSVYGAIGLCQFMPSNVHAYGVDADRDGRIDLFTKADALHSIANYLRGHGWQPGMDRPDQHRVVFSYNHSTVYANTVLAVADRLRGKTVGRPEEKGRAGHQSPAGRVTSLTRPGAVDILKQD